MSFIAILMSVSLHTAFAQADGCRGALDGLVRIKEQIVPGLSADTPAGRNHLETIGSVLEKATNRCKDVPELWFYRMEVSKRLGHAQDAEYAKSKMEELAYEARFDPFALPPTATPPPKQPENHPGTRKKWALVVGIDHFQDERIGSLHYAVKDSRDFLAFLQDTKGGGFPPAQIQHLADAEATTKGIKLALGKIRAEAKPDDLVVIYFASHGSPRQSDPNGMSYVMTHDTDTTDAATLYGTSLQMIDLVQIINREIDARNVVLILDTCYSGGALAAVAEAPGLSQARGFQMPLHPAATDSSAADAAPSFSASFQNLKTGYGRAVITASRADEPSWESPAIQNGYFTHYLVEVLREGHGSQPLERVFPAVKDRVATHVRLDQNAHQDPTYEFSAHADQIVLSTPESN